MKALIHIGLPKVGSSSIQKFLKINRNALLARGIRHAPLNPDFGSQFELAATGRVLGGDPIPDTIAELVLGLKTPDAQRAYVENYRAFLDNGLREWTEPLFVASSEHIQPWLAKPAHIAALDGFLRARFEQVRYVVYLRAQTDILPSAYSERIRRGETLDFDRHINGRINALNFNALVARWEKVVGAARLDVRLMLADALVGGDLIDDFCVVLNTGRDGLNAPSRMNTALSCEGIALRRHLNRWLSVRRGDGRHNPVFFAALRLLGRTLPHPGTRLTLTEAQHQRVTRRLAASNEALRARRFPDRETLF